MPTHSTKGGDVAICVIADNAKGSADVYEKIMRRVAAGGGLPPPGAIFQVAGPSEPGWRVISVWESREAFERFAADELSRAWSEFGVSRDDVEFTIFEVHSYVAGDMSGALQPGTAFAGTTS
jgi:hypothetical protein